MKTPQGRFVHIKSIAARNFVYSLIPRNIFIIIIIIIIIKRILICLFIRVGHV